MIEMKVIFDYNQASTEIQCYGNDKLKEILNKYYSKIGEDQTSRDDLFFLYDGKNINLNSDEIIQNVANNYDKSRKMMNILVQKISESSFKNEIISRYIICPECKESCRFKIDNYKITLFDCKNGHIKENIPLNEFYENQKMDISQICCDKCKTVKMSNVENYLFYTCLHCKINLCPICQSNHDKSHYIIYIDRIKYYCCLNNEIFTKYCKDCKVNLCQGCSKQHKDHHRIDYGDILPDKDEIKIKLNDELNLINQFDNLIYEINQILQILKNNFELLYNFKNRFISNFCSHTRNYDSILNLENIDNNTINNDIQGIINEKTILYKFNQILKVYGKMTSTNLNFLSANDDVNDDLKKEIEQLKNENNQLKDLNSKLKPEKDILRADIQKLNLIVSQLQLERDGLCTSVEEKLSEIKKIKIEKNKFENAYNLINEKLIKSEKENKKLQLDIKNKEINYNKIQEEFKKLQELFKINEDNHTKEIREKENEISILKNNALSDKKEKISLNKKIEELKEEKNISENNYQNLKNKEGEYKKMEKELKDIKLIK